MSDSQSAMRSAIRQGPAPGSRWQHYKGGVYLVVGMVLRESDLAPLVVYRPEDETQHAIFVRPLCEWSQKVLPPGGRPTPLYSLCRFESAPSGGGK